MKHAVALLMVAALDARASIAAPRVVVSEPRSPILLDGKLDDAAWRDATPLILTQQSPHPGEPNAFATEVRVLADARTIYLGFACSDPAPGGIAIHTMQRDGDMEGDDFVAFVFDTFGDQRTGYFFRVNAAGARADGLVAGPEDVSLDWDGIWSARVARTAAGWSAEIAIPTATLRFDPALAAWGFNAERYVSRQRLTLRWSGTTLDSRLADFRRAGIMQPPRLRQGRGVTANVNTLARRTTDFPAERRALAGRTGVDVGYNITPQLGGVLTIHTDFAETEVDTRQINLTQFPLFFPEKRAFFLEGSNQFRFGLNLGNDLLPFYSRRVGLVGGSIVPLNAGLKILGRAGKWGIAALDVATGATSNVREKNLFASRLTYDATEHLRIGALITNGDPAERTRNRFGGADATWTTSSLFGDKNFALGAWAAASRGGDVSGRRRGWGALVDYPNDLWDISAAVNVFGDALDPALGFLPRPGTRQYRLGIEYKPRLRESWIRQFFYEFRPRLVTDLDGRTLSWRAFTAPLNVESTSGVHLEANYAPEFQRLIDPFEIAKGVTIPVGSYRFDRFRVEGQSSPNRPVRVGTTVWFGTFFSGRLTQIQNFITWTKPNGRLQLELEGENDFGRLSAGNFAQRLLQSKVVYAATPNLVFSSYAQYDTDSRQVGVNNRLRWTIRPEADLFVVWNHGWHHAIGDDDNLSPLDDQFVVKLRWTLTR